MVHGVVYNGDCCSCRIVQIDYFSFAVFYLRYYAQHFVCRLFLASSMRGSRKAS